MFKQNRDRRELAVGLGRTRNMKQLLTPLIFVLVLAACGSSSEVGTGSGDIPAEGESVENAGPETADLEGEDVALETPGVEDEAGITESPDLEGEDTVISNDATVDPRVTAPTEIVVNPEDNTELWVRFVGGDPNCTAAFATVVTETPDLIQIELLVGITEDALSRSCQAGEFDLRVNVSLNESAEGKTIDFVQPTNSDAPQLITPDLTAEDFLGLSERAADAIVQENLLSARTVRVDDESFPVTEDFNPGRLNFEVDDGIITAVSLG